MRQGRRPIHVTPVLNASGTSDAFGRDSFSDFRFQPWANPFFNKTPPDEVDKHLR